MPSYIYFPFWSIWIFNIFTTGKAQCQGESLHVQIETYPFTLLSPGYGKSGYSSGTNCSWVITTDPGHVILYSLFIDEVDCPGGDVEIYYGTEKIFVENAGYTCGNNITFGPFSDNPDQNMSIVFQTSMTSKGGQGFYIHAMAVSQYTSTFCFPNPLLLFGTEEISYITSENFPADYRGNSTCEWRIASSDETRDIVMEIIFIDIETEDGCSLDFLQVKNEQSSTVRRLCGSNDFAVKRFKASEFSLSFHSDDSVQQKGFIAQYRLDNATKQECFNTSADIIFLIDTTTDAKQEGFNHQLMILQDVMSAYDVSKTGVRFSTVIYEDTPFNLYWLDEHRSTSDILNVTKSMPYIEGYGRGVHTALEFVQNDSLCICNGARENSVKLVVIFTFGDSDEPEKTLKISKSLHNKKVHIISIGVGNSANATELENIASEIENVFIYEEIGRLADFSYILSERICEILGSESEDISNSTYTISSLGPIFQSSSTLQSATGAHMISPTSVFPTIFSSSYNNGIVSSKQSLDTLFSSAHSSDMIGKSTSKVQSSVSSTSDIHTISISSSIPHKTYSKSVSRMITPSSSSSTSQHISPSLLVTVMDTSSTILYPEASTSPSTFMRRLSDEEKLTMAIAVAFVPCAVAFFVVLTIVTCLIAKVCNKYKQKNKCHVKNVEEMLQKEETPNWINMAEHFQISERAQLKLKTDK